MTQHGIGISNVSTGNCAAHVPVNLAAGAVGLVRGWVSVDITDTGRAARFVASHREPQETSLPLQLAQSSELIARLAISPAPAIIASDLNADPLDPAPAKSHTQVRAVGFEDAWNARVDLKRSSGCTCCEHPDLLNPPPVLTKRLDLILVRPDGRAGNSTIKPVDVTRLGDQPRKRTVSGL